MRLIAPIAVCAASLAYMLPLFQVAAQLIRTAG